MKPDRKYMYNFPWTRTDNPGAWIEVTDICNLVCPGCFRRNNVEGHKPLEIVKKEILQCVEMTNCSRISISGGEPLLYPHLKEVVAFITSLKLRSVILTNGQLLTPEIIRDLKDAGLFQFFIHVDNAQIRPGWTNKSEAEMNQLRQYYADMIKKAGKVKCGFNMTIRHSNFMEIPDIVRWFNSNIDKVNHLSLIVFRGVPASIADALQIKGNKVELNNLPDTFNTSEEFDITSNDVVRLLENNFDDVCPAAYLKGTLVKESFKLIAFSSIGSKRKIYGSVGAKTMEKFQVFNHKLRNKYEASVLNFGKLVFLMAFFDKIVRKTLRNYLKSVVKNPLRLFEKIYLQSLIIQQPFEIINGGLNLCDGCMNLMPHKGEMINSCRYDEYRLLGGPIEYKQFAGLDKTR